VVDDFEEPWTYTSYEAFDFIHARSLAGSVKSWPAFFSNAYTHLKPGGFIEIKQSEFITYSEVDPDLELSPTLKHGQELFIQTCTKLGKSVDIVDDLEGWMQEAGFQDVQREVIEVPMGTWHEKEWMREVGLLHLENSVEVVESFGLALFTNVLSWSFDDTRQFFAKMQKEVKREEMRFYGRFHIFNGRKCDEKLYYLS
jgi:hypothetical protein